jgi:carbonic anhydrase
MADSNEPHAHSRTTFLKTGMLGLGAAMAAGASAWPASADAAAPGPPMAASTPQEALANLKAGNARFVAGNPECASVTARIAELANGQSPFAIVLGCSDSRVAIETVFDQVPGHIFVVRIAGNYLTEDGLGSIEYSVAVLKSKLIVVLGHSKCGAVGAAVAFVGDGTTQPGHIQELVTAIAPAAKATKGQPGDWIANAVAENVKLNVAALPAQSSIVADAVKSGDVQIIGGIYDLHTGTVAWI